MSPQQILFCCNNTRENLHDEFETKGLQVFVALTSCVFACRMLSHSKNNVASRVSRAGCELINGARARELSLTCCRSLTVVVSSACGLGLRFALVVRNNVVVAIASCWRAFRVLHLFCVCALWFLSFFFLLLWTFTRSCARAARAACLSLAADATCTTATLLCGRRRVKR